MTKQIDSESQSVDCTACHKLIDKSVALAAESAEYIRYFCGAECFKRWNQ
ncbi:MAG: DUF3330 domain-containing protein [Coxiellaceae bacterium]|nr:DUF3330 domain-containing protein [Coxiellaceae bacterium]